MAARQGQNDAAARDFINKTYGAAWGGFLNDPELGPILMKAGYDKAEPAALQAMIQGTDWWRRHSDAQRKYITLEQTDPGQAKRLVWEKGADIKDMARSMGLNDADIYATAQSAVMYGWSDAQARDVLSNMVNMQTVTASQGAAATAYKQFQSMAGDYFVPPNDSMNLEFARRVVSGELNVEDVQTYYAEQAKQHYGYLSAQIDQGLTMKQIMAPQQQEIAKLLEVSPETIDFQNNAKYQDVLRVTDDKTKELRPMTVTETQDWARSQDEWKKTSNAQEAGTNMAATLAKTFGAVAM